ncbi:hypothetical protein GSI_05727 [Ganoderma sinense ZZ0214-1]|uniref:DUF6535 domain-containing protein n=1 Tax=Ganoderma sinense ZZ0214-1 TaxID=1077348 RepID=A0A2G8SBB8_9APHY|nr:hypothetical protein GSI_05727 [Ganoderma sinense ZZ0214-1]
MGQRTSTSPLLPTAHTSSFPMDEELGCTEATSFYDGWTECANVLRERDMDNINAMSEELDAFLEFSGIFSAVITLFVSQSAASLQPDTAQLTLDVLLAISQQLADPRGTSTAPAPAPAPISALPRFESAPFDIVLNALLNAGLLCSLIASGMSLWVKQWLREHPLDEPAPSRPRVRARVRVRAFRRGGLRAWRMRAIVACISILLQLSVLLFSAGVVMLAHKMNETLAWVLLGLNAGWWAVTWGAALCPTVWAGSPFRSPLSRAAFRAAYHVRRAAGCVGLGRRLGLGLGCGFGFGREWDVGRFRTLEERELAVTGRKPERDRLELEALGFANRELWGSGRLRVINDCFREVGDRRMALERIEEILMAHYGMKERRDAPNDEDKPEEARSGLWTRTCDNVVEQLRGTMDEGVKQLMRIWCEIFESGGAKLNFKDKKEAEAARETHRLFEAALKDGAHETPAATVREGCQEDIVDEKLKAGITILESVRRF